MKRLIFCFLAMSNILMAQTVHQKTIATGGTEFKNSFAQVSFTLGEPLTASYVSGSPKVTQGFQQTYLVVSSIDDIKSDFVINYFPIPATQSITIESQNQLKGFELSLTNNLGQKLITDRFEANTKTIDISQLAKGTYYITLTDTKSIIKSKRTITIE